MGPQERCVHVQVPAMEKLFTHRGILPTLNSLYDPLGFAATITIQGKFILKELMNENSEWDSSLPQEMLVFMERLIERTK